MKLFNGVVFRVVSSLILFGLLLTALQMFISFFVIKNLHGRLVNDLLKTEVASYLYQYKHDKNAALPHSKYIRTFRNFSDIPESMQSVIKSLDYGIYTPEDLHAMRPIHAAVVKLPDSDIPFYMFFDGRSFKQDHQKYISPKFSIFIIFLFLIIPGTLAGLYTSNRILSPIKDLIGKIKDLDPEKLPDQLSDKGYHNEIGVLTKTLEKTMSRIKQFIIREKEFTRDASHELRTPLTVIQGAVEIIEAQPDSEKNSLTQRALKRIKRSVSEMNTTIETFLFLAREDFDTNETCDVSVVLIAALEQNKHLLNGKSVKINRNIKALPVIKAPHSVMLIVINNIIRNAFSYTYEGVVTVTVTDEFIEITDTGVGIKTDRIEDVTKPYIKGIESEGFGIGLTIVERLCSRFNWKLDIKSVRSLGTTVRLVW